MKITKQQLKKIIKEEISRLGLKEGTLGGPWQGKTFEGGSPTDPNFSALDLYQKQLGQGYYGEYTSAITALDQLQNYPQLKDDQSKYYLGQTLKILLSIKEKDLYRVKDSSASSDSGFFSQVWTRIPRPEGYVNRWHKK